MTPAPVGAEVAPTGLSIGAVAAATGVAVTTLRYYDEIGLLAPSGRVGGKRRFGPEAVGRVGFIRRSQAVGFTLEEIRELLDDTAGGWRGLVAAKQGELVAKRAELDDMIAILAEVARCGCVEPSVCLGPDQYRGAGADRG